MPRLTKLYTRQGDHGETSLGTGRRVSKDDLRVAAYGTVDELNSWIGLALAHGLSELLSQTLPRIQNELFHLGSDLSFPTGGEQEGQIPILEARHVQALEELIDQLNQVVGPLDNFILPGGSPGAAYLQVARTVCRRAERAVVSLARVEPVRAAVLPYLNRLSDLLFVMSRFENKQRGLAEALWDSRA